MFKIKGKIADIECIVKWEDGTITVEGEGLEHVQQFIDINFKYYDVGDFQESIYTFGIGEVTSKKDPMLALVFLSREIFDYEDIPGDKMKVIEGEEPKIEFADDLEGIVY